MRPPKGFLRLLVATLALVCLFTKLSFAQATSVTPPVRDAQAVSYLQKSVAAMAATPPADSSATGSVTIVAGSETTQGTIKILTRGTAETSVQVQSASESWSVIFSSGEANKVEASATSILCLERAASSQSLHFPLPYLTALLNNPDYSLQYIGNEVVGTSSATHIRVRNTYNSTPTYQFLSDFTAADIWLDATTSLPTKIAMIRRDGGGSSPKIPISITYSNYQTISGVQYPFTIEEFVTETLWATTTIQSVAFSTGLTDASFPITEGVN
jgi:hypothetical protein